jgi:hypothetical protein
MTIGLAMALLPILATAQPEGGQSMLKPVESVYVDEVWSGASAAFSFVTRGDRQYVAYYAADRRLTVAVRSLGTPSLGRDLKSRPNEGQWTYHKLDETAGWDSHNYIAMALDSQGHIHLSGNMHGIPLRYYRTTKPEDITSLARVESMTGDNEQRVTYPKFFTGPKGEFLFSYRDGGSGNGSEIVNAYDVATRKWKRYIPTVLFDGQGEMNAYFTGPVRDRNGAFHYAWVWRDTPDCATNHDVSYARSSNLLDFARSDGSPVRLPMTLGNAEVIDPVPVKSGLLNNVTLSCDSHDKPMITYHKFDQNGLTQVYIARREDSGWRIYRTTEWKDRWEFSGGGSISSMISFEPPRVWETGKLCQVYTNKFQGDHRQVRFLDEATLRPVGEPVRLFPADFETPSVKAATEWQVNIRGADISTVKRDGHGWVLRWESASPNRDQARETVPPPSRLEVVMLAIR